MGFDKNRFLHEPVDGIVCGLCHCVMESPVICCPLGHSLCEDCLASLQAQTSSSFPSALMPPSPSNSRKEVVANADGGTGTPPAVCPTCQKDFLPRPMLSRGLEQMILDQMVRCDTDTPIAGRESRSWSGSEMKKVSGEGGAVESGGGFLSEPPRIRRIATRYSTFEDMHKIQSNGKKWQALPGMSHLMAPWNIWAADGDGAGQSSTSCHECSEEVPRCPWIGKLSEWDRHRSVCPHVEVPCRCCKELVPRGDMLRHEEEECPYREVPCPNRCGELVRYGNLRYHILRQCVLSRVPCHFCDEFHPRGDLVFFREETGEAYFVQDSGDGLLKWPYHYQNCSNFPHHKATVHQRTMESLPGAQERRDDVEGRDKDDAGVDPSRCSNTDDESHWRRATIRFRVPYAESLRRCNGSAPRQFKSEWASLDGVKLSVAVWSDGTNLESYLRVKCDRNAYDPRERVRNVSVKARGRYVDEGHGTSFKVEATFGKVGWWNRDVMWARKLKPIDSLGDDETLSVHDMVGGPEAQERRLTIFASFMVKKDVLDVLTY